MEVLYLLKRILNLITSCITTGLLDKDFEVSKLFGFGEMLDGTERRRDDHTGEGAGGLACVPSREGSELGWRSAA